MYSGVARCYLPWEAPPCRSTAIVAIVPNTLPIAPTAIASATSLCEGGGLSLLPAVSFAAITKRIAGKTNAISVHVDEPVSASAKSCTTAGAQRSASQQPDAVARAAHVWCVCVCVCTMGV